ncbi:MAG: CdaR family protein [Victivallaceae bacterium]|nr:CdaR family protein [Victivallaceae bacterium]
MKYLGQKILHFFFSNGLRKIIALLLAVIIYAAIYNFLQKTQTLIGVIVDVKAEDKLFLDTYPKPKIEKVDIVVSGPPREIANVVAGDFRGEVTVRELDAFTPGFYRVPISPKNFQNDGQVRVIKVLGKSYIPINAQRRMRQYFDVQVKTTGNLSGDYKLGSVNWEPRQIQVEGPENILKQLQLPTLEIALAPENISSFDRSVELCIDNPDDLIGEVLPGDVINPLKQKAIKVTVEILAEDPVSAVIPEVGIKIKQDPVSKYEIKSETRTAELIVIGVPSQVAALKRDPKNIEIYADIAAIAEKPGTHSVPLLYSLPKDGVKVQKITPERIDVVVAEAKKGFLNLK